MAYILLFVALLATTAAAAPSLTTQAPSLAPAAGPASSPASSGIKFALTTNTTKITNRTPVQVTLSNVSAPTGAGRISYCLCFAQQYLCITCLPSCKSYNFAALAGLLCNILLQMVSYICALRLTLFAHAQTLLGCTSAMGILICHDPSNGSGLWIATPTMSRLDELRSSKLVPISGLPYT